MRSAEKIIVSFFIMAGLVSVMVVAGVPGPLTLAGHPTLDFWGAIYTLGFSTLAIAFILHRYKTFQRWLAGQPVGRFDSKKAAWNAFDTMEMEKCRRRCHE